MKTIVTLIPTDLVTNLLLCSFCPFLQTKNKNQQVGSLQKHVKNLKRLNEELQKKCEEHEQYGRLVSENKRINEKKQY